MSKGVKSVLRLDIITHHEYLSKIMHNILYFLKNKKNLVLNKIFFPRSFIVMINFSSVTKTPNTTKHVK